MERLADISRFEAVMNGKDGVFMGNAVFNDGGEWKSDGWHSYSEVPAVDPDDGWNDLRRENPELFIECNMVSPDDGKNWLRLADPERFQAEDLVQQLKQLAKRGIHSDKKIDELIAYIVRGAKPYNEDEAEPFLEKLRGIEGKEPENPYDKLQEEIDRNIGEE